MNYQAKQDELDKIKWLASEKKGADACGDFDYCVCCDKSLDFPCASAAEKLAAKSAPAEKPVVKTAVKAKAAQSAKPAATAEKETAAAVVKTESSRPAKSTASSAAKKSGAAKKPTAKN